MKTLAPALTLIALLTASLPAVAEPESVTSKPDLEARGHALRKMFEPYIARANGKENWKFNIILKDEADEYFPKGMTFEDAVVVLKAAGFNINIRPVPRDGLKYWQFAWLSFS